MRSALAKHLLNSCMFRKSVICKTRNSDFRSLKKSGEFQYNLVLLGDVMLQKHKTLLAWTPVRVKLPNNENEAGAGGLTEAYY